MKLLIFFLLIVILLVIRGCAKEYSCEGCYHPPTIDTAYNDLITSCDIYIEDESQVRAIYPQYISKYYPTTYQIFETINMDGSCRYKRTYDLKNYFKVGEIYVMGDIFFVRYEIRWKFKPAEFVGGDTLIY